jgi:FtsP/CotA-like multicopper oxidase with cupredoxin domain
MRVARSRNSFSMLVTRFELPPGRVLRAMLFFASLAFGSSDDTNPRHLVPVKPEVHGRLTLVARTGADGHSEFHPSVGDEPPMIRVRPGEPSYALGAWIQERTAIGIRDDFADTLLERPSAVSTYGIPIDKRPPIRNVVDVTEFETNSPDFTVNFTGDKSGFYINGEKYQPDAKPMTKERVSTYQHRRIVNSTREIHPMHIHQVHFLAYAVNGYSIASPVWLGTVNAPIGGCVDAITDPTDPVIRGISVFQCHLLNHEDKGMMAKTLFQ